MTEARPERLSDIIAGPPNPREFLLAAAAVMIGYDLPEAHVVRFVGHELRLTQVDFDPEQAGIEEIHRFRGEQ